MTKINKILMHGFKSFGKRTELTFGNDYNCVLGPNGSGKCVTGDTLVQLADGSIERIDNLVDSKLAKEKVSMDDGYLAPEDGTHVLSMDTNSLKIVERPVKAFVKRTSPERLVKIRTRSGREITSTEYHPLFSLQGERVVSLRADELKEGTRIAVPRSVRISSKREKFYGLLDQIKYNDNIYVPYNEKFREILSKLKQNTWRDLSEEVGIPLNVVKGLLDKQAINFQCLVAILRHAKLTDEEIIQLIPKVKSKTGSKEIIMIWQNSVEFSRFLGYLLSEGRLTDSNQIWFTNGSAEVVNDYWRLVKNIYGEIASVNEYKASCWDIIFYSSPLITILKKFGVGKAGDKYIPNIILNTSTNEQFGALLDGLYSGDGYISNSINIVSKSKQLATGIQTVLLRLGICSHMKKIIKIATNTGYSGEYYSLDIYGQGNISKFREYVHLTHDIKRDRLAEINVEKPNPNVDLMEANSLVKQVASDLNISIKKNRKKYPTLDAYSYNQCTPSREGVQNLIENLFVPSGKCVSLQKLSLITYSDLLWDEIIEVENVQSDQKWVYDLCVEGDHNFIANNIVVHNSNVLDALCFVLGKSGSKSLRAEKSGNLVYNGGKTKKPAKEGEVSIFFDNQNKVFPMGDKEVKISRIVRQTGQSKYKINNKNSSRQQILDLLSVAKINPNGYNIVLQGDIVKLVDMTSDEKRRIIEEISGISVYEEKKNKALRELEKVDGQLNEAEIILKERGTYLKELRKDRDKAMKYKASSDKLNQNQATLLHMKIAKKDKERGHIEEQTTKLKVEFEKYQEKIDLLKKEIAEKKEEMKDITKQVESKGEKGQVEMQREIEKIKVDIATNKTRIGSCENELTRIAQRKEQLQNNLAELESKMDGLGSQKKEYLDLIHRKQQETTVIEKKIAEFKKKHKLDKEGEAIEQKIEHIDKDSEEKQVEIQKLREEQQNLLREKDKLDFMIQSVDDKVKKVKEIEAENKQELQNLKNRREKFKTVTLELNKALDRSSALAAESGSAEQRLYALREEHSKLAARNAGIKEQQAGNIAIRKILEQKDRFKGVYGTVAELGKVSSKYSQALEAAAGARINGVVVENDKVAADCIKFLKSNKLGSALFLPMNKIKGAVSENGPKGPGIAGKATDLVQYESRFKTVFSYVFGNTIVVDNIDVARRVGIGAARMATLTGDLTETSGAMHGGFRAKAGASFKEKDVSDKVERLDKEIAELQNAIAVYHKQKAENEDNIVALREEKAALEGDIIKTEKSLHLEDSDLDASKKYKRDMEAEVADITKKINNVGMKVSEVNRGLAMLKIEKQKLRDKINKLKNPRLIAELNAFEEKKHTLREEVIKAEAEIKGFETQADQIFMRDRDNTSKILRNLDKEESGFKEEIKLLKEKIKGQESECKEKEAKQKEFYAKFKTLFSARNKLSDQISKADKEQGILEEKSRNTERRNNAMSLEIAKVKAELAGLKEDYARFEGVELFKTKTEDQLKKEIRDCERMKDSLGSVNMRALEIYETIEKEYNGLLEKKTGLHTEKDDVLKLMDEIEGKKKDLFMKTYDSINEHFMSIFKRLSTKGDAYLELENPDKPFDGGMGIRVRLTGTRFMDLKSLSGGEKTMTALAFIFAVQEHEPASFYVLDEVDAALDKHNAEKLASLIRKYTDKAQYVIISHNDAVISEADTLYGVSMDEHGISKVVSLKV